MSERERIAYEELKPGDLIQPGDEWQNPDGRWHPLVLTPGSSMEVRDVLRARRPHNITWMLTEFANQAEVLAEVRTDEKRLLDDLDRLRGEYLKVLLERDEAQAALKSAQRARDELQQQVDELREQQSSVKPADQLWFHELTEHRIASLEDDLSQVRADRDKLQGLIDDLLDEPTARQVQDMLRTWATELDWSADCFDSEGRDQINSLQRILIAVMERIEGMINPEGTSADA